MDASPVGLAATLVQTKDGVRRVIGYPSRSLTLVESRYSQTESEGLACIWGCEHFRRYLMGPEEFDLITDHQALRTILALNTAYDAVLRKEVPFGGEKI